MQVASASWDKELFLRRFDLNLSGQVLRGQATSIGSGLAMDGLGDHVQAPASPSSVLTYVKCRFFFSSRQMDLMQ
jgi:hypothetical protein